MSENLDPGYTGEGMYRENIIDHYKNPHNKGSIEDADAQFTENNATCGDVITVQLKVKDGIVKDIKFQGRGCAISQAAMSMLTGEIKGKSLEKAKSVKRGDIVGMKPRKGKERQKRRHCWHAWDRNRPGKDKVRHAWNGCCKKRN